MVNRISEGRSPAWGRTLVELIVASGLLMLLTASCAVALRSAMDYHRRIGEQTDLENSLMFAVGALVRDGSETAPQAIAWSPVAPEGPALTFPIPRAQAGSLLIDHAAGNRLLFGSVVSYRVLGPEQELRRYVDVLPSALEYPPHPLTGLTPPRDAAYFTSTPREHKVLAKGVRKFEIEGIDLDEYTSAETVTADLARADLLRATLELEREGIRRYAVSMVLEIVPQN